MGLTLRFLCTRSFLQEIRFLSLVRIDGNYTYLPNGITYTFLLISFVSCNIYICYELNDFLLYFIVYLLFSFDVIIIALFLNGITYTFLLISFVSCNIYICYELNDFLLYFIVYLLFSFDVIIIALFLIFVNAFLNFISNILFIIMIICFKTIIFLYFQLISDNLFNFQERSCVLNKKCAPKKQHLLPGAHFYIFTIFCYNFLYFQLISDNLFNFQERSCVLNKKCAPKKQHLLPGAHFYIFTIFCYN